MTYNVVILKAFLRYGVRRYLSDTLLTNRFRITRAAGRLLSLSLNISDALASSRSPPLSHMQELAARNYRSFR